MNKAIPKYTNEPKKVDTMTPLLGTISNTCHVFSNTRKKNNNHYTTITTREKRQNNKNMTTRGNETKQTEREKRVKPGKKKNKTPLPSTFKPDTLQILFSYTLFYFF